MAKLISDTNIWYEIGFGTCNPQRLKVGGNTLIAIPTSIVEIASPHPDERIDTWQKRRKAAAAILNHADEIVDDTEKHLAALWGLQPDDRGTLWRDICEIIAGSESLAGAESGVGDRITSGRLLKVSAIQEWRLRHWEEFKNEVESATEDHVPGYKQARANGEYTKLPKDKREQFRKDIHSDELRRFFIERTFLRALPSSHVAERLPTEEEYAHTAPLLAPFIDAFLEYIYGCATSFAPQPNDFGDCECFIYLQDGNMLVTCEKRWREIARRVCPANCFDDLAANRPE